MEVDQLAVYLCQNGGLGQARTDGRGHLVGRRRASELFTAPIRENDGKHGRIRDLGTNTAGGRSSKSKLKRPPAWRLSIGGVQVLANVLTEARSHRNLKFEFF